ncbi:MAG: M48 family metallopeptidase, partial [Fimbriimonadaceae bacterium]|nr:M48 family metallopeptidase [Chitinophagales bacterium]
MRKSIIIVLFAAIIVSCSKVPITQRKQVSLLPESEMVAMSLTAYKDFLNTNAVVESGNDVTMVNRVADNISKSVETILKQQGYEERIADFKWEVNVVKSDEINAWCMPGGKIIVYTGILPITKNETGLAVVMGHEVAHAVARHGNERMSQQLVAYTGFAALDIALANKPQQTRDLLLTAVGVGATVG